MPRRASAPSTALPAAVVAVAASATVAGISTPSSSEAGSAAATAATAGGPSSNSTSQAQAGPSTASTSKSGGPSTRPRRIMPSRSRRGGPGVGISDVDTHILETLRRRRENEPLIPAHTEFLLTTNSARAHTFGDAAAGSESSQLNTSAYERYFDKPEVIRAYREQQLIQTPEFTLLSEHEAVGGRFRPRSLDDEGIDTSDAAYEKRHRKYETFEKRQRLREKEKLKHEHYKLKERIEQLRALEPSTFLSAPDSFFACSLCPSPHSQRDEPDAQGATDAPASVPAPSHNTNTGEWRKRQMLDVANSLEARYRTLLDTAPSRAPDLPTPTPPPVPATPLAHTPSHSHTPALVTAAPSPVPTSPTVLRVPPLPLPTEVIELDSDGEEKTLELVKSEPAQTPMQQQPVIARHDTTESLKLRIKFPSRAPPPPTTSPRAATTAPSAVRSSSPKASASPSPSPTRPRPKPIFKNPAAPSPHARVPFAKRIPMQTQDATAAAAAADGAPPSPHPSTLSPQPQRIAAAALPLFTASHPTLRRRLPRTAAQPKPGSPAATAGAAGGIPTSGPQPQLQPPSAHAHGLSRPRKRARVELSDEDEELSLGLDTDDEAVGAPTQGAGREDAEEGPGQQGGEGEGEGEEGGGGQDRDREQRRREREHWRECALYREAQRHTGAPNARKTHRHLGIFGLRGFPAEIEHPRDFVPPQWALPRADPRLAPSPPPEEREREKERRDKDEGGDGDRTARGAEGVRAGAAGAKGGGGDGAGVGERRLQDSVAVAVAAEDEEELSCAKSDPMAASTVETMSALDSQATEVMIS
ncbi:hypothetical protein BJV74DRAFT_887798 [Russula compacta]|nr:hypothetical protein BJV74DRAFT_887798 [Russula compacta]